MRFLILIAAAVTFSACSEQQAGQLASHRSQVYWPDRDMDDDGDSMWQKMDLSEGQMVGQGRWKNKFWLRFDGGTVSAAESFIVKNAKLSAAEIPAFEPADLGSAVADDDRDALIEAIVQEVKNDLSEVNVEIWTSEPDSAPYSVAYVGGSNFTGRAGTLGIAPLDIGNFSGNDILFIFAKEFLDRDGRNNITLLAQTITHEITHSLGGRHIDNDSAIMNPIVRLDAKFLDREGPVVAGDGRENTKNVLVMNVGMKDAEADLSELPEIVDLAVVSEGSVAQLSVLSLANFDANPERNLTNFEYSWAFGPMTATGPSVRLFVPNVEPEELKVTVSSPDEGLEETYTFMFGRTKKPQ